MNTVTKNFWMGVSIAVALGILIAVVWACIVWGNRYLQWEHIHPHKHPAHVHQHEHLEHKHPHELIKHDHPFLNHDHKVEIQIH